MEFGVSEENKKRLVMKLATLNICPAERYSVRRMWAGSRTEKEWVSVCEREMSEEEKKRYGENERLFVFLTEIGKLIMIHHWDNGGKMNTRKKMYRVEFKRRETLSLKKD